MPWWLVLLVIGGCLIYNLFLADDAIFRNTKEPSRPMKNLERVKREIEQKKKAEAKKSKQKKVSKTNNSNIDAGALLAGAALAHQMRKHHKHDDTKETFRDIWDDDFDEVYDDDFYDYNDIQDYDDIDYDNYIAEQIEEQAAYDDFIASLDMDDD